MCEAEKDLKFPNYIAGDGWVHHSPVFYLLFQLLPRVGSESIFSLNYLQKFLDFLDGGLLIILHYILRRKQRGNCQFSCWGRGVLFVPRKTLDANPPQLMCL